MTDAQLPQALPPTSIPSDARTLPIIVYVLYLVGVTNGLTAIIGFVIALASRAGASPALQTHYRYQIRTFIGMLLLDALGVVIALVSLPLMLVGVGFATIHLAWAAFGLGALYLIVRSIIGLIRLAGGEPYPNPDSWTI